MRVRTSLATTVLAGTAVLAGAGTAFADAGAQGSAANSPGVIAGNQAQVPLHVPINACGDTVDVIGALNPAFGNACANE